MAIMSNERKAAFAANIAKYSNSALYIALKQNTNPQCRAIINAEISRRKRLFGSNA